MKRTHKFTWKISQFVDNKLPRKKWNIKSRSFIQVVDGRDIHTRASTLLRTEATWYLGVSEISGVNYQVYRLGLIT
mgnify:CR=1 FL=1